MPEPAAAVSVRQRPRPQRPPPPRAVGPTRAPARIPPAVGRLALGPGTGGGQPLAPSVAKPLSASLGVDVADVRVHTDASAAAAAETLGARAFAVGNRIFLGARERPTDLALMAHEVAHVVQQRGGAMIQRWTSRGGDAHEREAHRASAAVVRGESFAVRERTAPRVQRLGISDVLDYFADKANLIPGFRMFTIIIGVNPVNMSKVDRSAANILRAIIEFIPGGGLVTQALDNYGVFEKVGGWVEQQIGKLGMTGSLFKKAIDEFLDSLGWSDIFDLGGVWDRAKRIFTEPIRKLIDFAAGLITGILGFIKDAILRPLAKLAEGTRGYDLLKAVLGRDPITDEEVPQTADTLIGGFMKLIGQDEVWENIKKANAIPRAWTWFQGALKELLAFVRGIPGRFVAALKSLELVDIVVLPNAFKKVVGVFAGIVGDFLGWALKQVLSLLQIIFEVLAPAVMPYVRKAMGAFKTIIANPVGFIGNLVKAGVTGFKQFAKNFLSHLRTALIQWLTGTLSGANIYIPQAFEIREIIKFVLSVLGLTWQNIRGKLVTAIGDTAVKVLEEGFDIVVTLVKEGPAAAWEKIKEQLSNLKEMVMEQVMAFVRDKIVEAAITKILTSLNPAGAFIQAILAIYNTVMFVVERLRQIGQVVASFIDSISAIAAGAIGAAANRVEQTMAGLLTLVISFLARFAGLGKVSDMVLNIVKKIRAPIDKAIDKVIEWVVNTAKKLGKLVAQAGVPKDPKERLRLGLKAAVAATNALRGKAVTAALINPVLAAIRVRYGLKVLEPVQQGPDWWIKAEVNPTDQQKTQKQAGTATGATGNTEDDPIDIAWVKPRLSSYKRITLAPKTEVAAERKRLKKARLSMAEVEAIKGTFTVGPKQSRTLDGVSIGVSYGDAQTAPKFVFQARAPVTGNGQKDAFNALIERWGYNREDNLDAPTDGDHVLEKQLGGPDSIDNVWPLNSSTNRSSGSSVRGEITRIKGELKVQSIAGKWLKLKF